MNQSESSYGRESCPPMSSTVKGEKELAKNEKALEELGSFKAF